MELWPTGNSLSRNSAPVDLPNMANQHCLQANHVQSSKGFLLVLYKQIMSNHIPVCYRYCTSKSCPIKYGFASICLHIPTYLRHFHEHVRARVWMASHEQCSWTTCSWTLFGLALIPEHVTDVLEQTRSQIIFNTYEIGTAKTWNAQKLDLENSSQRL